MNSINTQNVEKTNHERHYAPEPIRGSIAILAIRVLLILFLLDGLYGFAFYTFTLGIILPFDLHHHLSVVFFLLQIVKNFVQTALFLNVGLTWANNIYYLTERHIIKRSGIFTTSEEIYQYSNIRSVMINQSFIGKLLNYGDIYLKTSASGGYQGDIVISGIENPKKYKSILEKNF